MTPRSIRRAAERKAMKAARKAERTLAANLETVESAAEALISHANFEMDQETEPLCYPEPSGDSPVEPLLFTPSPLSIAQLAANRANAQLSTGPTSQAGRATSSLNAVKTGLTGRTVLLPTDDAPEYERHLRAYTDEFSPVGQRESDLVQSIADTMWRLKRIPSLEAALFAQGHVEFAEAFNPHEPALRAGMIEVQTFIKYEKQLRNLQLQESRLVRRRERETAELRQLQQERERKAQERERKEYEALATASRLYNEAKRANQPFDPQVNGFVFSIEQIEEHLSRLAAQGSFHPTSNRSTSEGRRTIKQAA
jgi:hypothetical protein